MATTTAQLELVQKAMNDTKNKKMFIKYQAISLHLQGYTNVDIATIIRRGNHTVGRYIQTFKELGMDGLIPKRQKGANCKLTPEQEQILVTTISENTPDQVGLSPYKNWNCKLISAWVLHAFGITYSKTGVRDLLHRLGMSYTRPTYVLAKADPEKQMKFKQEFETIKKTDE